MREKFALLMACLMMLTGCGSAGNGAITSYDASPLATPSNAINANPAPTPTGAQTPSVVPTLTRTALPPCGDGSGQTSTASTGRSATSTTAQPTPNVNVVTTTLSEAEVFATRQARTMLANPGFPPCATTTPRPDVAPTQPAQSPTPPAKSAESSGG